MHQKVALISEIIKAGRKSLEERGFTEVVVPRIVRATGACENVNTLFEVSSNKDFKWFGSNSYLAQTGQLYLEALVPKLEKVYCAGPSFRAEPAVDSRHLTEFFMMEIEFAGDFNKLLKEIETFIKDIAKSLVNLSAQKDLGLSAETIQRLASCPDVFTKLTYDEAIAKLTELGEQIEWGDDISSKQEKILVEHFGNQPMFITRYPDPMTDHGKEIEVEKFFNMLPDPENPGRVLSSDLILPFGGESVGSAARVHLAEEMVKRLKNSRMFQRLEKLGGSIDDFSWYIEQLNQGSVPHAGCGFGMARIIQWIMGTTDIRQAVTFASNKGGII
ncbi:MAG: amino acid--tRNA ligase-related protein [Candidatus Komeilibacteria bacterium]|nr:amino acid--tRNA ligase-related protein [Candidatus Komeilibacteria bacterium]